MEEKRKSYKPEIKDEREEKLVSIESLEPGEVFIRSDDLYMVAGGAPNDLRESLGEFVLVIVIDLANGRWVKMSGREFVRPVKTTITIE